MSGPAAGLVQLCQVSDVEEGTPFAAEPEGFPPLAVFVVDGKYFVTDNICTHSFSLLTDGFQDGAVIECSVHGGTFDIPTGEATAWPCVKRLRTYPVVVDGDSIYILTASEGQDSA